MFHKAPANQKLVALIVLLLIHAIIRIPTLFEPAFVDDEGFYISIGRALINGSVLFKDISDINLARPGLLYLIAGLAGNHTVLRSIALIGNTISLLFFFSISYAVTNKLFTSSLLAFAFIALTSTPLLSGNEPRDEIFFIPLVLTAVFFLLRSFRRRSENDSFAARSIFWAGLVLGLAVLMKIQAIFDAAALTLALITIDAKQNIRPLQILFRVLMLLSGIALPILLLAMMLFIQGVRLSDVYSLFSDGILWARYLYMPQVSPFGSPYLKTFIAIVFAGLLYALRRRIDVISLFIALWAFFAISASLLSNIIGLHYTLQAVPPLLLTLVKLIDQSDGAKRVILIVPLFLFGLSHFIYPQSYSRNVLGYYREFVLYTTGQISKSQYYLYFSPFVIRNYEVADMVRELTNPNDQIFIWGNYTEIYNLSRTIPSTKYIWHEHIESVNAYDETIASLEQIRPVYIITFDEFPMSHEWILYDYIESKYTLAYTFEAERNQSLPAVASIYKRKGFF